MPLRDGRAWLRAGPWALGLLLGVYLALAFGSARQKSVTVDELGHLPSGLYFLQTGDPRYTTLNPPLVNALSALPVLFLETERTPEPPPASDDVFSYWSNGYHFQERHRADYQHVFDVARTMPILVVACLGVLLFLWGRRLAPEAPDLAGLLAAGLVLFSPNVLAQARIVGTDTGTAFFVALAVWSLHRVLERPSAGRALLCGLALGLSLLAKHTSLLLYPTFLGITLAWHALSPAPRPQLRHSLASLVGAAIVGLLVLNSGYLWHEVGESLTGLALQSPQLQRWQDSLVGGLPLPLPGAYVRAFDGQLVEVGSTIPSFLFGESFEGGRWYFYLALLAIKTPLGLFVAFGLALFLSKSRPRLPHRQLVLLLSYPVVLFLLLSFSGERQLGGRALLSAVPFVWLWAAATIARTWPKRWPTAIACGALLATLVASIATFPDYISYFNAFVGGSREGYRYTSTSDVDIGQDLVQLADYLEAEGAGTLQLLYFGSVDPALYGIDFEIPEGKLEPGLLAVSVSLYRTGYPMYDDGDLRLVGPVEVKGVGDPIARIGGSIHVYRIEP